MKVLYPQRTLNNNSLKYIYASLFAEDFAIFPLKRVAHIV